MFRVLGVGNRWILFGFILAATLIEDSGKRIYSYVRKTRTDNILTEK